ncbi:MAG: Spy/CpxP family protein refolding chaperone [Deltaproteobacteria bacterium]|nr:Spy/CpxP family protein refolding chaperone [Deltaproteobacteria bacterium]
MSRAAWTAIIAAIAFPTIALVIVILARPGPPPGEHGPPPPGLRHGPPPPRGMHPEMLVKLRKPLELTDEQVDRIWDIIEPTRRRMMEINAQIEAKEEQVRSLLETDDPDEKAVEALVEEVTGLHAERAKLEVLTPLKVRKVLTPEQRTKLMEIWKERPPGPPHTKKRGLMPPRLEKHPPHKPPPHPPVHEAPPGPPPGAAPDQPFPPKITDFQ